MERIFKNAVSKGLLSYFKLIGNKGTVNTVIWYDQLSYSAEKGKQTKVPESVSCQAIWDEKGAAHTGKMKE